MKHFYIIVILFATMAVFSCSSDDENNGQNKKINLIDGTWYAEKEITNGKTYTFNECERTDTRIFKNDGRFDFAFYGILDSNCGLEGTEEGDWELKDDKLIYYYDVYDEDAPEKVENDIIKLTESELRIRPDYNLNYEVVYRR